MARVFETPRPMPSRLAPVLAGATVIVLALPVFVVAGLPARGLGARRDALGRRAAPRPAC